MEKEKLKSFSPMYKLIFQLTIELHYVRIHSQKTIKIVSIILVHIPTGVLDCINLFLQLLTIF